MATYTEVDSRTGEVVREVEIPDASPPVVDVDALRTKLAKATTTAGLKAVLADVLDALDQP